MPRLKVSYEVTNKDTSLSDQDVIAHAVQFFSIEGWKIISQSPNTVTFDGRLNPPVWMIILLIFGVVIGFMACVVPGIIILAAVPRNIFQRVNLVVATRKISRGAQVLVTHPKSATANKLIEKFLITLPSLSKETIN